MTTWVDVNDRLPTLGVDVLVWCGGDVTLAYLDVYAKWDVGGNVDDMAEVVLGGGVSHWMALPENAHIRPDGG